MKTEEDSQPSATKCSTCNQSCNDKFAAFLLSEEGRRIVGDITAPPSIQDIQNAIEKSDFILIDSDSEESAENPWLGSPALFVSIAAELAYFIILDDGGSLVGSGSTPASKIHALAQHLMVKPDRVFVDAGGAFTLELYRLITNHSYTPFKGGSREATRFTYHPALGVDILIMNAKEPPVVFLETLVTRAYPG